MRHVVLFVIATAALVAGCAPSGHTLRVDVATELVAGRELARVEIALVTPSGSDAVYAERVERLVELEARFGLDLSRGQPVATFSGVEQGVRVVRVRLLDFAGRLLATTRVQVLVSGDRVVRVRVSRACVDVSCPPTGGLAALSACVGGRCVHPRCGPESPELCPEVSFCALSSDCARTDVPACASLECVEGECVAIGDDARCADAEYCDEVLGCTPRPASSYVDAARPDAFVEPGVDAGPIDAAIGPDAFAIDAGPSMLCEPPGQPCRVGLVRTSGGATSCVPFAELVDGTPCGGAGEVCAAGECLAPVSLAELPAAWASTECALLRDCFGAEHVPPSCEVRAERSFLLSPMGLARAVLTGEATELLPGSVALPVYDELDASRCLHALRSRGCAALSPQVGALPAECEGILRSPVAAPGACLYDFECGAGWYCGRNAADMCGECKPVRPVTPGGACLWSGQCAEGYECRNTGAGGGGGGGACLALPFCGAGLGCTWPMTCVDGACRPVRELLTAPAGMPCDHSFGVSGPYCRPELDCVDGVCTPPVPLGAACQEDQRCEGDGRCLGGTCSTSRLSVGEPCTLPEGPWIAGLPPEYDEWWLAEAAFMADGCADEAFCDFTGATGPACRAIPAFLDERPLACLSEFVLSWWGFWGWWLWSGA